jgi:hypothetical protein
MNDSFVIGTESALITLIMPCSPAFGKVSTHSRISLGVGSCFRATSMTAAVSCRI